MPLPTAYNRISDALINAYHREKIPGETLEEYVEWITRRDLGTPDDLQRISGNEDQIAWVFLTMSMRLGTTITDLLTIAR